MKAKKLTKAVITHLSETLRLNLVRDEPNYWKGSFWIGDWEVAVGLSFSGQGIECEHWLVRRDDPQVFAADAYAQFLGSVHLFDLVRRLGIGPTWWIVGCEQELPAVLGSIAAICLQVISQLPMLLKGLELDD